MNTASAQLYIFFRQERLMSAVETTVLEKFRPGRTDLI